MLRLNPGLLISILTRRAWPLAGLVSRPSSILRTGGREGAWPQDPLQPPGNWLPPLKVERSALDQWLAGLEAEVSSLVVRSPIGPHPPPIPLSHSGLPTLPSHSHCRRMSPITSDSLFCLWSPSQVEVQIHFHPEAPSWLLPPRREASSAVSLDRPPPRPGGGLFCPCPDPNTAFPCAPGE